MPQEHELRNRLFEPQRRCQEESSIISSPKTVSELMPGYLERVARRWTLLGGLPSLREMPEDRVERMRWIRSLYRKFEAAGMQPHTYFIDWLSIFTPIERAAWASIRACGLPMWPQYPVGRFFADFADPETRMVIECDGRDFHQDRERDASRDAEMHRAGWIVFRLRGAECMQPDMDWQCIQDLMCDGRHEEAQERIAHWLNSSSDGVIRARQHACYGKPIKGVDCVQVFRALEAHTSAPLVFGEADHA